MHLIEDIVEHSDFRDLASGVSVERHDAVCKALGAGNACLVMPHGISLCYIILERLATSMQAPFRLRLCRGHVPISAHHLFFLNPISF